MRRALLVAFLAFSALAADRGKYQEWDQSPAGYFMTEAERTAWAKVSSEAEAEKFVSDFLAKREPGFTAEVTKRAQMADKYLTVGKTQGSKSLRGKVIILFGPPSGMTTSERTRSSVKRDNPQMAGALSNAGSSGAGSRFDDSNTHGGAIGTMNLIRTYAITYSDERTRRLADEKDVTFLIEADAATGEDRFASRTAAKDAETLFERAAQASLGKEP
jgi:GWxTD domain-containing protein